jgi:ubiquinone/menaquinone biosynthesis C-methylase UbiE
MTHRVNYDLVAPAYDKRYERNRYDGVEAALRRFIGESDSVDVAEVGCGTGHWLARLCDRVHSIAGVDRSPGMLQGARTAASRALLVRGRAEELPWATGAFDRLFCINALHHFDDGDAFMLEARRVLRPGGALLTIGLDPHTRLDRWWIYDYFPGALTADRSRYASTAVIRDRLEAAGFAEVATDVAQHMPAEIPFEMAKDRGLVDRRSTSQLMVISQADYDEGLRRLEAEQPILKADLRLYATVGWAPSAAAATRSRRGSLPRRA